MNADMAQARDSRRRRVLLLSGAWLILLGCGWGVGAIIMGLSPRFDGPIVRDVHAPVSGAWTSLMRDVTFLGMPVSLDVVFAAAAMLLAVTRQWRLLGFLILASPGLVLLHYLVHVWVDRPRPLGRHLTTGAGGSWPSGHATESTGLYGGLLLCALQRWDFSRRRGLRRGLVAGVGLLLLAIGVSRVVLGVHYPSDVVGGWLLAGAWLFWLYSITSRKPAPISTLRPPAVAISATSSGRSAPPA